MFRTRIILEVCLGLSAISTAKSQDFYGAGVSARTVAQAGIYLPASDNVIDALSVNPAGLSALTLPVGNLSFSAVVARGSFSNASNSSSPMSSNKGLVPMAGFGMPLGGSRWSIGLGVMPDLLSVSHWNYADTPGVAGASYGAQKEQSAIVAYRSAAGVGFRITPKLSVGVAFGIIYNGNTLEAPYIFQSNPQLHSLKTLLDLHTSGIGFDESIGISAQPTRRLSLNASYRTASHIRSTGTATGNMSAQFATLGVPFQPGFAYDSQVKVVLPQTALAEASWRASPRVRLNVQADFIDWKHAFHDLPVVLTHGSNSDINGFLGSTSLSDVVPLNWKDQFTLRGSVERRVGENLILSGGIRRSNNPVPSSTLTPLTAAIMQDGISGGAGYRIHRTRFDLAYGYSFSARQSVKVSGLAGEYNNSSVRVGAEVLSFTTTFGL